MLRKLSWSGVSSVLGALSVLVLASSCAPPAMVPVIDRTEVLASAGDSDDGKWNCPASNNVTLKSSVNGDSFDYSSNESFRVCVSATDTSEFLISGRTASRSICVFPMYYGHSSGSSSPVFVLNDQPKCFNVGSQSIETKFTQGRLINYMIIVDYNYYQAMSACLGSPSSCPTHAEGFVQ